MFKRSVVIATASVLLLSGCSTASSDPVAEEPEVSTGAAADVALCGAIDPAMNKYVSAVLAGSDAAADWAALNPIFLGTDPSALESADLVKSAAVFAGITLTSAVGNEEMIGTKTADLLYACESVGAPMELTQATLDAATQ